jgi:hypothetical protein
VVGRTGFGKTTLLSQAVLENGLDPLGIDRWLRLTDRDRHPEHLLAGLAEAAGGDPAAAADVDHVVEIVWSQAPTDIAFLLDDVHVLDGSAACHTVERLCERLPTNGHLVLGQAALADVAKPSEWKQALAAGAEVLVDVLPVSVRDSPLASYLTALRLGSLETGEFPHHLHAILRSAVDEGDHEMAALALWRISQPQADIDHAA